MNDNTKSVEQSDEAILSLEVSDEALEAAASGTPSAAGGSPLGFQVPLRCGIGGNSGTQEGQQVGIYRVCIRGWHAVREALVGL